DIDYSKPHNILERYLDDLKFLGFSTTLSTKALEVILMVKPSSNSEKGDFHFIRKDPDGLYSEKDGWGSMPHRTTDINEHLGYRAIETVRFEKSIKKSHIFIPQSTKDNS
ncbi:MAG: hypothetical protein LBM09_00910, partial [Candidatus Nomurabacteria bacterium]|nr:hypothetical protein [Candidatus Nomurabacteria bacterium]